MKAIKADLHVHTCFSKDSLSEPRHVLEAALRKGLGAIAITDHDGTEGALEAAEIAKKEKMPLQVIVGEEISTQEGHLLAYFVKERIAPGPLAAVLCEAKRQGAFCCAAHPFDFARRGIDLRRLPEGALSMMGAIEALNARATLQSQNSAAELFARERGLPMLAGSDAHHPSEIGAAHVEFSGVKRLGANELARSSRRLCGGLSSPLVRLHTRYAALRKKFHWRRKSP